MKYVGETLRYMFTHILKLALIMLPTITAGAFFMRPAANALTVNPYVSLPEDAGFAFYFDMLMRPDFAKIFPAYILIFILMLLSGSYMFAVIEKHFKVGRFTIRSPIAKINDTLNPVFKTYLTVIAVVFAVKFLLVCLDTFLNYICRLIGISAILSLSVTVILNISLFTLVIIFLSGIFMAPTIMLIYGYRFWEAFGVTLKLSGKGRTVAGGIWFPFAVDYLLEQLLLFLPMPLPLRTALCALIMALVIIYLHVYVMIAAYDFTGIERRDKVKPYYLIK